MYGRSDMSKFRRCRCRSGRHIPDESTLEEMALDHVALVVVAVMEAVRHTHLPDRIRLVLVGLPARFLSSLLLVKSVVVQSAHVDCVSSMSILFR